MKRLSILLFIGLMLILSACTTTPPAADTVDSGAVSTTTSTTNEPHFRAKILEIKDTYILVEPLKGEEVLRSADRISFGYDASDAFRVGDKVIVYYTGDIMETYPAKVHATRMEPLGT